MSEVKIILSPWSKVTILLLSTFSNISLETTGPIKVRFHMELLWDRGMKVCSNGPGHMTKMAAMPV